MEDATPLLKDAHPFEWDARIHLDEETHTYYVDGASDYTSVSKVWASYFKEFDADACVDKYFASWAASADSKYHALIKYVELVQGGDVDAQKGAIKTLWSAKGTDASTKGTLFHKQPENYMNGLEMDHTIPEVKLFLEWRRTFYPAEELRPFRAEMSIFDPATKVAGQIDSLWIDNKDRLWMVDWKRCDPMKGKRMNLLGPHMDNFDGDSGTFPFEKVPNTSFGHYSVQQNCYKHMLEKNYGVKVYRMFLVQCHPSMRASHSVEVPDLQKEVGVVFCTREAALATASV